MAKVGGNKRSSKTTSNIDSGRGSNLRNNLRTQNLGRVDNNDYDLGRVDNNDYEGTGAYLIPRVDSNDYDRTSKGLGGKGNLRPNLLHQFASYNTIFTLSGINEQEMKSHKFLTNPVHDIIARTGGIGGRDAKVSTREFDEPSEDYSALDREGDKQRYKEKFGGSISILERGHDLFIENVNMISTASPNPERGLGNFT